jgi:plasmid maintenance system antidote protein VapI
VTETSEFNPDWVSPPGHTISDILEERLLSHKEFAQRIGYSVAEARELLHGQTSITMEIARSLEAVLGASAAFWINRETQYRNALARRGPELQRLGQEGWLSELPVKDMVRFGWLEPTDSRAARVTQCLRFFGVTDVDQWRRTYRQVLEQAAFKTSPTFASQPGAVAAWLRQGELESASTECGSWDALRFKETLQDVRRLTRKRDPKVFLPELKRLCASCGVAVVIVRAPAGCHAGGATRFLSADKALLLLSFRFLSDDHFWFTFFHEAGHLLLHGKTALFLEGTNRSSTEEEEANEFSARTLIPFAFQAQLETLPVGRHEVRTFAKLLGVSPGIVVGQLQHLRRAERAQLNNLKARFNWE